MPKLPRISPDEFIGVLKGLGFSQVRQVGSHKIFKNSNGLRVTVPYHRGEIIHPKILKTFLNDSEISIESFIELL